MQYLLIKRMWYHKGITKMHRKKHYRFVADPGLIFFFFLGGWGSTKNGYTIG